MNILFLFPDQWRWDYVGWARQQVPVRTPNLDRLAEQGVVFDRCYTNSPLCAPARAAMVQGVRYERCGVPNNGVDSDPARPTYMKQLRQAGYRVAGSGKFDLFKPSFDRGLEGWTDRLGEIGFTEARDQSGKLDCANHGRERPRDLYSAHLHRVGLMQRHAGDYDERAGAGMHTSAVGVAPTPLPRESYTDDFCGRQGLELLGEFPPDQPWYLWVNFPGPHDPFDPPAELADRYRNVTFPLAVGEGDFDCQPARRAYAACCEGIDEWCGRLIDAVEQRGERDRTLIVFAADHGEMLGDHARWRKAVPYEPSVHVPLVIAGPGVVGGRRSEALVELIDLAATFTEAADADAIPGWDSRSLWPMLRAEGEDQDHRAVMLASLNEWKLIFDGRWKYVRTDGGSGMLFDLRTDPGEQHNRIDDPECVNIRQQLAGRLQQELAGTSS